MIQILPGQEANQDQRPQDNDQDASAIGFYGAASLHRRKS